MNEKILIIALFAILGIGFVGILFVVFPWISFSNWEQTLIDDGLIIVCLIMFVYGFYMNTRMH